MSETFRIIQLSDTHFLQEGVSPEGGFAYDTAEAFDAVFDHITEHQNADMVVVTGDVADHGEPAEYERAARALGRFDMPVNICPGNHDQDAALTVGIGRPGIGTSRVVNAGGWCHLFVDSNAGVMLPDEHGRHIDPVETADRLHRNGTLGAREIASIEDTLNTTSAEHVFVWVHHPPSCPIPMVDDANYASEWDALLTAFPIIKGIGAGHTHIPDKYQLRGSEVVVAPSLKHNFDLDAQTWLPPGYWAYNFHADGTFDAELHLVDDARWPRRPFGRALMSLFQGEITHTQLAEITMRRQQQSN